MAYSRVVVRKLHAVIETPEYLSRAIRLIADAERSAIVDHLARNPTAGDLIPGTGGARKLRWAREGGGKSGGVRIVTYFGGVDISVFLLTMFAKNEKSDLAPAERNQLKQVLGEVARNYREGVARNVQSRRKHPSWR
jgi:hypothetical protein